MVPPVDGPTLILLTEMTFTVGEPSVRLTVGIGEIRGELAYSK